MKKSKRGHIHFAHFETSPRLQRLARFLARVGDASTRAIMRGANVCAVNSAVDELRENGFHIRAERVKGKAIWVYALLGQPARYRELMRAWA